uniref:Transposase n=1 Tax=Desulfatirhabdium butyrativorans TaxID=340467 RepID=A0A7C4RR61_9BACT
MPRVARAIAVGYPHHITQRGNYRQAVFVEEDDYLRYVEILSVFAPKYGLDIWAYCLMPNHVHIVGVPGSQDTLAKTFNTVHMLYAQYFNKKRNVTGHLWQGRFYSCVLDPHHLYAAVRYVELNPVRSGIVSIAHDYPWSSAKAHLTREPNPLLSGRCPLVQKIQDWAGYLGEEPDQEAVDAVIQATKSGRPCGTKDFILQMEGLLNRRLAPNPRGRPVKSAKKEKEV